MKKSTICLLLSSLFLIASCNNQTDDLEDIKNAEYNKGYEDGLDAGYTSGYFAGSDDGYEEGYNNGYNVGEAKGKEEGAATSQTEAYQTGYDAGIIAGEQNILENVTLGIYPGNNLEIHTEKQANYLKDSYSNIGAYANGTTAADNSKPLPIKLYFGKGDAAANSTFKILVSESADLTNAWTYETTGNSIDVYNCKLATKYYWKVAEVNNVVTTYPTFSFTTKDTIIRNLNIGTISNARDLGNFKTEDNKTVKQGLIYRSAGLNWVSSNDSTKTPDQQTLDILTKQLGVKTDIDLANRGIVPGLNRINCQMGYQNGIINDTTNYESIKKVFQTFADSSNYPVIYHCTRGRDRTGAIAFLLEALLGVKQEDMYRDFLFTNFGQDNYVAKSVMDGFIGSLNSTSGTGLKQKAENYLKNIGITDAEISNIRNNLLED